jgi:hypothetical protein
MSEAVTLKITSYPPPPWRAGSSIPVAVSVTVGRNVVFTDTRYRVTLKCGAKSRSTATPIESWTQTLNVSIPCDCVGEYASITVSVGWKPVGALESYTASDTVVGSVAKPELPAGIKPCSPEDSIYATFLPPATPGVGDIKPAIYGVTYRTCTYSSLYCGYISTYSKSVCTYAREPCTVKDIIRNGMVKAEYVNVSCRYKLVGLSCNPPDSCLNINITPGGPVPTDRGAMYKPHTAMFTLTSPATVTPLFAEKTKEEMLADWPAEWKEDWAGVMISGTKFTDAGPVPTPPVELRDVAKLVAGRELTDDEKDSLACCAKSGLNFFLQYVQGMAAGNLSYLVSNPSLVIKGISISTRVSGFDTVSIASFCGMPLLTLSSESQTVSPGMRLRLRGIIYAKMKALGTAGLYVGSIDFQYQPGGMVVEGLFTAGGPAARITIYMTGVAPAPTPTPPPTITPTPTPTMIPTPWVPPPAWPTPTPTPTPVVIPAPTPTATPAITPTPTPAMTPTPPPAPLNIWLALAILGASGVGGYFLAREVSRRRKI